MSKFADLSFIAVIEVLPSAKYFHGFEAGIPHAFQPNGSKPVSDKKVRRQYELHLSFLSRFDWVRLEWRGLTSVAGYFAV